MKATRSPPSPRSTPTIAEEALALIEVDYEVLPHVIDVDEAMKPDAPLLFEDMITRGVEPAPTKPSNVSKRLEFQIGDLDAGLRRRPTSIVEKEFKTAAVHQGYIEPHACVARVDADGQTEIWSSSQGHFVVRALTAKLLGMPVGDVRVTPGRDRRRVRRQDRRLSRAGRGAAVARNPGAPVKITMSRDEVFKATGPTSGSSMRVKIGVTKDGKITAAEGVFKFQAGAFPGSPVMNGVPVRLRALQHRERAHGRLRRRLQPAEIGRLSRAGLADLGLRGRERRSTCWPRRSAWTRCELRLQERRRPGHADDLRAEARRMAAMPRPSRRCSTIPAYKTPLGPNQGRGVASGYWFNGGGESSATVQVNEDGTVIVATGSPDIGGSRASMALMAAETLGIDYNQVRSIVADTASVGYTHVTGGSRVTFATGMAVVDASKKVVDELRARAAMIWDVDVEGVIWEDGHAKPACSNVGDFPPMSLKEIAGQEGADRRPDHRRRLGQCRRPGARLLDAVLRCRGRSRDRQGDDPALCRGAGCRQGDPPLLCRGADPGRRRRRASAGRSTRSTSTTSRAGSIMPASSTTACRSPPTCR